MPVFALYNFDDVGTTALDSALGNGAQNGLYLNGATAAGGQAVLDGANDIVKVFADPSFQLDRGTLDISFTLGTDPLSDTQTVLSRDSAGLTNGGYHIDILADGSVVISHETPTGTETFGTAPGFANPGDSITLSYSWDQGGSGGQLSIDNSTTGGSFDEPVPNTLTMDMGDAGISQPWIIGAGQSTSTPNLLNNIDQHFQGSVTMFQLSDTVDNCDDTRDGIVRGTPGDDLIDVNYPNDNDGDFVDRGDAILPGDAPQDDRILAGDGNDTVDAGRGDDSVEGGTGNDVVNGRNGDDTIFGQDGDDALLGQAGNDVLYGGLGNDYVRGGTGDDLIDTSGDNIPLPDQDYPGLYPADDNPNDDLDTVRGGEGNDTIRTGDDRDVIEGGYGNDLIDAGFDDDTIDANQGNDTIIGAEGNDLVDGGQGDDLIYGGYGPDVPDAVNFPDSFDQRPDNGRDLLAGGMGNDTIYGMDDDDTIDGGQDNDLIYGGIDDDVVRGNVGDDQLFGDDGDDSMGGGQGNDTLNGGQGTDVLSGEADRDLFLVGSQGNGNGNGDIVYGGASGDDWDALSLVGAGPYRLTGVTPDSDGNGIDGTVEFLDDDGNVTGSLSFTNIEEVIPCFTPGTMIATPKGEVLVESLKAGDRVITRDNGIQEIRWTGQKALGWKDLAANPHLKPVLIRQGSLGNGLPERDMMVSPNHRMLVANDRTALYFDEHEVLVSAKHLVAGQGIHSIDSIGTTYIHFMFDRHEVVLSNGAWTESFQPGDYTLKGMGNSQRNEIFDLFPELKTEAGLNDYQAARRTLKKHEARLLVK